MRSGVRRTVGWKGWSRQVDAESASEALTSRCGSVGENADFASQTLLCADFLQETFRSAALDRSQYRRRRLEVLAACAQRAPCYSKHHAHSLRPGRQYSSIQSRTTPIRSHSIVLKTSKSCDHRDPSTYRLQPSPCRKSSSERK